MEQIGHQYFSFLAGKNACCKNDALCTLAHCHADTVRLKDAINVGFPYDYPSGMGQRY